MTPLTTKELEAVYTVLHDSPLKGRRRDFEKAMTKLRFRTGTEPAKKMPVYEYGFKWVKNNKDEAESVIEKYQHACRESAKLYWSIRCQK